LVALVAGVALAVPARGTTVTLDATTDVTGNGSFKGAADTAGANTASLTANSGTQGSTSSLLATAGFANADGTVTNQYQAPPAPPIGVPQFAQSAPFSQVGLSTDPANIQPFPAPSPLIEGAATAQVGNATLGGSAIPNAGDARAVAEVASFPSSDFSSSLVGAAILAGVQNSTPLLGDSFSSGIASAGNGAASYTFTVAGGPVLYAAEFQLIAFNAGDAVLGDTVLLSLSGSATASQQATLNSGGLIAQLGGVLDPGTYTFTLTDTSTGGVFDNYVVPAGGALLATNGEMIFEVVFQAPEPGSLLLVLLGAGAIAGKSWRRRS
jgi:hypothetical protein